MDKHTMANLIKTLLRDEVLTNNDQEVIDYSIENNDDYYKDGNEKSIVIRINMKDIKE